MKILRKTLDQARGLFEKYPALKRFYPLFEAADELFFGTDKVTSSPHIMDGVDLKRYMSFVIIALLPTTLAGIYFYGLRVIAVIAVSYICGGLVEVAFSIFRKRPIHEGFLVTGLIFPLVLPPSTPLWIVAVGVIFGAFFGKEVFGGTGRNIFNPALVGRLFITLAFPGTMSTSWQQPIATLSRTNFWMVDAITSATPLAAFKTSATISPYLGLLVGGEAGCIGEIFRLGIIIGGIFLMLTKVSNWRIPVTYLTTVFILGAIGHYFFSEQVAPCVFQLLSGGLLFGAMFMATDPVTSPLTKEGKYIYGIGCGVFTVLIRSFSGYVEGTMFSIILMNAFAPLIDHIILTFKYKPIKA